MDQRIHHRPPHRLRVGAALAAIILAGGLAVPAFAQDAGPVTAADSEQAKENLALFDKLDFEGWNGRNWELFRQLHADSTKVEGFGQASEGVDDHVTWAQGFIEKNPNSKIEAHPIRIGAGDWTAVTGRMDDGSTMATIARWENGQIAEEYLFTLATGQQ